MQRLHSFFMKSRIFHFSLRSKSRCQSSSNFFALKKMDLQTAEQLNAPNWGLDHLSTNFLSAVHLNDSQMSAQMLKHLAQKPKSSKLTVVPDFQLESRYASRKI